MFATLGTLKFQKYFDLYSDSQVLLFKVPGRMHPVEVFYTRESEPDYDEAPSDCLDDPPCRGS